MTEEETHQFIQVVGLRQRKFDRWQEVVTCLSDIPDTVDFGVEDSINLKAFLKLLQRLPLLNNTDL